MKRRTEITIEIDRVVVINQTSNQKSWCDICGTTVSMATASEAAEMLHASKAVVYRLAEAGILHIGTTTEVMMWICTNSLLALIENSNPTPSGKLLIGEIQSSV